MADNDIPDQGDWTSGMQALAAVGGRSGGAGVKDLASQRRESSGRSDEPAATTPNVRPPSQAQIDAHNAATYKNVSRIGVEAAGRDPHVKSPTFGVIRGEIRGAFGVEDAPEGEAPYVAKSLALSAGMTKGQIEYAVAQYLDDTAVIPRNYAKQMLTDPAFVEKTKQFVERQTPDAADHTDKHEAYANPIFESLKEAAAAYKKAPEGPVATFQPTVAPALPAGPG